RSPRTLAGVRADGTVLLVTIDGRRPSYSRGATLLESARVLRSLGAREGLALDGGGSTTMAAGSRLVGRPSGGAQRAVSDALVVTP
ncbi:MAG: phosphodiester glycosidase family protein, partial [Actinomycetota bacterium]|nr:phosphodiester glycosidase family protein [Actinomycetota bacterium]